MLKMMRIYQKTLKVWQTCGYCGRMFEYCWEMLENMGNVRQYIEIRDCCEEGKYVKIWEIEILMKNYRKLLKEIWEKGKL